MRQTPPCLAILSRCTNFCVGVHARVSLERPGTRALLTHGGLCSGIYGTANEPVLGAGRAANRAAGRQHVLLLRGAAQILRHQGRAGAHRVRDRRTSGTYRQAPFYSGMSTLVTIYLWFCCLCRLLIPTTAVFSLVFYSRCNYVSLLHTICYTGANTHSVACCSWKARLWSKQPTTDSTPL